MKLKIARWLVNTSTLVLRDQWVRAMGVSS